jgi:hypothetical protein
MAKTSKARPKLPTPADARKRLDGMDMIEADELAKLVFGAGARAHLTRYGVRIYVRTGPLSLRLLAKGERWSEVFAAAIESDPRAKERMK